MTANTVANRTADHEDSLDDAIFVEFDSGIARRFLGFITPYRSALWIAFASVLVFVATQVSIPILIRVAVDSAVHKPGSYPLGYILAAFTALICLNALASFVQEWASSQLAQTVIFDLRRAMFAHVQNVALSFLDQTHVGRLMSRLQGDVNSLQEFLEGSVAALGDLVLLFGIVAVLLVMDWRLGLLTLAVLPALIGIRMIWVPRVKDTFRRAKDASSSVNAALAENINGVRVVIGARREELNFDHFEQRAHENLRAQVAAAWAAQIMVPAVDILTGVAQAVVVIAGGWAVTQGRLDLGVMIAFIFYVQRFFDPIRTLSLQYTMMQRAMAAGHRIFEVLDVPVTLTDKPDALALSRITPSIEFRNVTFGYKPGQPALRNMNLNIAPFQTVALVGPTGSGKTSIAALLHRFYDVWEGQVLVGGHDVRDVTQESLGHVIAMVPQEPFLFTGTVLENILFNSGGKTRADAVAAAKAVRAHDFIESLPQGYDTKLDQRGQNLSLGQRQLLSFARALVADPQILILDEATASIDSFTERDIQYALNVIQKGRTSLVIAHRLATIRHADLIIVLNNGQIVEQGAHESLVETGGLYADLNARSFASFDDAEIG